MRRLNKFLVMTLMAFAFKLIYSQSMASYTFQIVNPLSCGGCCSATACISNVVGGECAPVMYAFLSSTCTNVNSCGGPASCTANLCNGTYTAVTIGYDSACPVLTCSVDIYYPVTTSLKDEKLSSQTISFYPVPANNELNIQMPDYDLNNWIIIYNCVGQVVKNEELKTENRTAKIDINDLSNGIYFVTIKNSNNEGLSKKLIVSH